MGNKIKLEGKLGVWEFLDQGAGHLENFIFFFEEKMVGKIKKKFSHFIKHFELIFE